MAMKAVSTPYLRLERAAAVAAAVEAFDERIDSPHASPVQIGEIRTFTDPYRDGRRGYACTLLGGKEVMVIIPLEAANDDTFDAVSNLVDTVMAALEPPELEG